MGLFVIIDQVIALPYKDLGFYRNINQKTNSMENYTTLHKSTIKARRPQTSAYSTKENLAKKRPSNMKLDLEKIFQESIELTRLHRKLASENVSLKAQHQKVEQTKSHRQNLIAMVEKIVKQKYSEDRNQRGPKADCSMNANGCGNSQVLDKQQNAGHSSWLVHKLNSKIYELKNQISTKQKAINELELSKENEVIRRKETEIECLEEVLKEVFGKNLSEAKQRSSVGSSNAQEVNDGFDSEERRDCLLREIKQIVWMEQEIAEKEEEIMEAERLFQEQDHHSRKLMMEIAKKKTELSEIKQLEEEYFRAQEELKEERKKKEQRIAGNKSYLDELIQARHQELKRLEQLKEKYTLIEAEESQTLSDLEAKLHSLRSEYEAKKKARQQHCVRVVEKDLHLKNLQRKWVKRVAFSEVEKISRNLKYQLALRKVPKSEVLDTLFCYSSNPMCDSDANSLGESQGNESLSPQQFSILDLTEMLTKHPFSLKDRDSCELIARYCIEDETGSTHFMEDISTSESGAMIRSVLSKLIGEEVPLQKYSAEELEKRLESIGSVMSKFHSLVQQAIESKESASKSKRVPKELIQEAVESIEQDLNEDDIEFVVLYLYSFSGDVDQLEVSLLKDMAERGIKWNLEGKKSSQKNHLQELGEESEVPAAESEVRNLESQVDAINQQPNNSKDEVIVTASKDQYQEEYQEEQNDD